MNFNELAKIPRKPSLLAYEQTFFAIYCLLKRQIIAVQDIFQIFFLGIIYLFFIIAEYFDVIM